MLVKTFGKAKTDKVELVATIYFCLDEIEKSQSIFSDRLLLQKVYSWSKQKEKFTEEQIRSCLKWMNEKGLTPLKN